MPFDTRIVPGAWVKTRFGKAVCITVEPHDHSLDQRYPEPGHVLYPCEDDDCKGQRNVMFRYRARRPHQTKDIWVANGDLTGPKDWMVKFLAPPTRFTARIVKLEGPYGEGKPACGPYVYGYCACGEPVHG